MGSLFSKRPNRAKAEITDHDRATLSLKMGRDKLKQTCKRYEVNIDKDRERARSLLKEGHKDLALLLLKRKRYQESMVNRISGHLEQVERMITDLEMTQMNKDVMENMRLGNEAMKILNEAISLDEVEKIMEESREAQAFQEELSSILAQNLSEEDNDLVEEEYEHMIAEQLPAAPSGRPEAEKDQDKREKEKTKERHKEAVALEAS